MSLSISLRIGVLVLFNSGLLFLSSCLAESSMRPITENVEIRYGTQGVLEYMKGDNLFPNTEGSTQFKEMRAQNRYEDIAFAFITNIKDLLKIENPKSDFENVGVTVDQFQMKHVVLQQVFHGIPLWGKKIHIHLNRDNKVYLFQGNSVPTLSEMNIMPVISKNDAVSIAIEDVSKGKGGWDSKKEELVIYYIDRISSPRLAYVITLVKGLAGREFYIIDAATGEILKRVRGIHSGP
jgi:Zn-dependent metalloprotease